ncbi:MAG: OmpH family outer membrane protein [Hyphomonadaceae bacterium]|nr:OmpH family outer membrane protein [Hyphomonadaceae bacterium]
MRPVKALIAAGAIAGALAFSPAAFAQAGSGTIMVIDAERILEQTAAGRDMQTKLQQIAQQMQGEITPEQTSLQQEGQRLQGAMQGQTPEQVRANTQLAQQIEALQRRSQAFQQRQMGLARDLEYTRGQALAEFQRQTAPIILEVMQARGASAALEASIVSRYLPSIDATQDVLSRIDQRVRTINVSRLSAPPPPQQQAQAPAPAQQQERRGNRRN